MIKVSEIPVYLKNSEIYKTLVEKKVNCISDKNVPLYKPTSDQMSFEQFEELLKTIYFWGVPTESYPIEFYMYIHNNLSEMQQYFNKFNNGVSKRLLNIGIVYNFLIYVIVKETNLELLNYMIQNSIIIYVNEIFKYACLFNNLTVVTIILKKMDKKNLKLNDGLVKISQNKDNNNEKNSIIKLLIKNGANDKTLMTSFFHDAVIHKNIDMVKFFLNRGINIHFDSDASIRFACISCCTEIVKLLLEHSIAINSKYTKQVFSAISTNYEIHKMIDEYFE